MWGLFLLVAAVDWSEILFDRLAGRSTSLSGLVHACVCTALVCLFLAFPTLNKLHLFWLAFIIIAGSHWQARQAARRRRQRLWRAYGVPQPVPLPALVPVRREEVRVDATKLSVNISRIVRAHVVLWDIDAETYGVAWMLDDGSQGADLIGSLSEAESIVSTVSSAVVKRLRSFAPAPR
jgi:hypothetical protein